MTWHVRAHKIIAALCLESYRQANKGKKRHVPYSVPETAMELIECLNTDDEKRAKAIMLWDYHADRVTRH